MCVSVYYWDIKFPVSKKSICKIESKSNININVFRSIYLSKEKSKNDLEILMVEKIIKTNPVFILKDIDGVFQVYPGLLSSQV